MYLFPRTLIVLCLRIDVSFEENSQNSNETDFAFNFTHIVFHGILFCGPNIICNKALLAPFNLSNLPASGVNRCGICSCQENCATFHSPSDCCPDIFFRHGLRECLDVNILSNEKFYTEISSYCPVDTNEHLSKECTRKRSKVEVLLNPPVTNSDLSVTYLNEYCATCNKVGNVIKWNAEFRCLNETDFNYLSTFEEIIELATRESCNIVYNPKLIPKCLAESDKMISTCNVSGSWVKYDKQIEKACQSSYFASIGIFKNMYCMMCNPPEYQKSLMIEECTNVSSVYRNACLNFPSSDASRPFKNHFCFLCNFDERNSTFFTDVRFSWAFERLNEEPLVEDFPFRFHIEIFFDYNYDDLNRYIDKYISNSSVKSLSPVPVSKEEYSFVGKSKMFCPSKNKTFFPPPRGINLVSLSPSVSHSFEPMEPPTEENVTINLNKLILKSFAFSGHGGCSQELLPNYTKPLQRPCSCDIECTSSCCDDFAFKQPWICVDNRYKRDSKEKVFMAINGCLKDRTLEPFCKGSFNEHFYHAFPVTMTSGFFETYVNVFCYFCNQYVNSDKIKRRLNATLKIRIWPLLLDCRTYVNYRNFQSLQHLIDFSNKGSCIVSFDPPSDVLKCSDYCNEYRVRGIQKCNVSGTWRSFDENVQKACEYTEPFRFPLIKIGRTIYKNKFCRICNPFKSDSLGKRCDINFENTNISKACEEFPDIKSCFPYKNVFCKSCSRGEMNSVCYTEINERLPIVLPAKIVKLPGMPFPEIVMFRTLFTLDAYKNPDDIDGRKTNDTCQHNQIYDDVHHTCRKLTCFPGRYLVNDTCVPLLPFTSKLRYTLGLKINFSAFISINITIKDALKSTSNYLSIELARTLNTNVFIEEIIIMGTEACATAFHKLRNIYIYIKIFIDQCIQREQIENALLKFTQSSSHIVLYFTSLYLVKSSEKFADVAISQQTIFLPSLLWKFDNRTTCFVLLKDATFVHKLNRNTFVSPLLSCKQFEMHNNEFGIDWANIKDEISFPSLTISVHPYQTSDNGGIRICVDDLFLLLQTQRKELHVITPNKTALEIITLVCIVISLVSLAVTFITYLLFPSLRTVPGLNNMCLVISLFMAQLSMVSSTLFRSSGLKIVFAFTHFSWLATFFWLQVCSFHMYRVFSAKSRSTFHGSQTKIIMTQYGIYAFGLAAMIVGANIICTLIVSSGKYSGYDKISTLLTYKIAFIITVIIPLIFVCMINILFYILTVYNIHSTPNVQNKTGNRLHFSVYIKLFSITGLSWLLQIIDMFLELSLFTYIVAILNGLQGLFIFVSYVCNRRVLKMYAGLCCKANRQYSSQSSRTSNTAKTTL